MFFFQLKVAYYLSVFIYPPTVSGLSKQEMMFDLLVTHNIIYIVQSKVLMQHGIDVKVTRRCAIFDEKNVFAGKILSFKLTIYDLSLT